MPHTDKGVWVATASAFLHSWTETEAGPSMADAPEPWHGHRSVYGEDGALTVCYFLLVY